MKQIIDFLQKNTSGYLATSTDNTPHLRPWGFMYADDNKLWFCTANTKEVFNQLKQNPQIEFSSTSDSMQTIRLSGEVTFSDNKSAKERIISTNSLVRSIYKSADNPIFEVFYLDHGKATISDFSGNPPINIEF